MRACQRHPRCRPAEKGDEFAPSHGPCLTPRTTPYQGGISPNPCASQSNCPSNGFGSAAPHFAGQGRHAVRDRAIRAEVHLDPEIRKTAGYFQQKTTELHALNRSVEEIRTRLVTQIDRLAELKIQLGIVTAAQIGEALKGGELTTYRALLRTPNA